MKYATTLVLSVIIAGFPRPVAAVNYEIDFGLVTDLEKLRPLIDRCVDLGELEQYRSLHPHWAATVGPKKKSLLVSDI
jgi:hypothetical protein